jgi:type I restriction enzyme S subunit
VTAPSEIPYFFYSWEQRKLGSITESFSGGTPVAGKAEYYGGEIPFIRSGEISSNSTKLFITDSGLNNSSAKLVEVGDILYALYGATSGEVSISRINGAINQAILAIRPTQDDDSYMIVQWLKKQKETIISTYLQGGQGNLSSSIVKDLVINLPKDKSEQTRIGDFFKQIDDTITLHKRKLEKLKQLKKAYLQQLFPKSGETVSKIRFANFEGEWKEHKLGEVADRFDNLRIPITASDRISGDIPYYGANGIQDYVEGFTHDGEFILVAEDGANDLKNYPVQYVSGRIWVNNHAHVLQGKKSIADNKFLMNAIKNFNIEPFLVGGGRAKLNADVMMKIVIKSPSHVEQQKIGTFFKQLDNITTLHQSKLVKLKLIKQSLLQKMFI